MLTRRRPPAYPPNERDQPPPPTLNTAGRRLQDTPAPVEHGWTASGRLQCLASGCRPRRRPGLQPQVREDLPGLHTYGVEPPHAGCFCPVGSEEQ